MNSVIRWLFSQRDMILYVVLASIIVHYKYNENNFSESKPKSLDVDEFGRMYLDRYGYHILVDESLCLMDGKCIDIINSVDRYSQKFSVIREMMLGYARISHMRLKLPSELIATNLDSRKWDIDKGGLASESYLMTMIEEVFVSGIVPLRQEVTAKVLSIGLGGGYIDGFLHHHFPSLNITVVELNPKVLEVARKWFQLVENDNHRVILDDGLAFIRKAVEHGEQYDVVLLDACTMDTNVKLTCPAPDFTTSTAQDLLAKVVKPDGAVITNLLSMRYDVNVIGRELVSEFERVFHNCVLKKSPRTNLVLTCSQKARPEGTSTLFKEFLTSLEEEEEDFV